MGIENAKRDLMKTIKGFVASCAMMLSFGWLFYILAQPKPIATPFEIGVLAVVALISAIFMLVFSIHLAMSVLAAAVLVEGVAVLLALAGSSVLYKIVHPYARNFSNIIFR